MTNNTINKEELTKKEELELKTYVKENYEIAQKQKDPSFWIINKYSERKIIPDIFLNYTYEQILDIAMAFFEDMDLECTIIQLEGFDFDYDLCPECKTFEELAKSMDISVEELVGNSLVYETASGCIYSTRV